MWRSFGRPQRHDIAHLKGTLESTAADDVNLLNEELERGEAAFKQFYLLKRMALRTNKNYLSQNIGHGNQPSF